MLCNSIGFGMGRMNCRLIQVCILLLLINQSVMVYIYSWLVCDGVGTPFWKLVLKQFDDLLVKVCCSHIVQVLYEVQDTCVGGCVV